MRISIRNLRFPQLCPILKYAALPLLVAIYPAIFHYANNNRLVLFSSLAELCIFLVAIGLVIFLAFSVASRGKYLQSAVGATLLLSFFHVYGFVFDWLRQIELLQFETYNFLPVYVFIALYFAWAAKDLKTRITFQTWRFAILTIGVLVVFNFIKAMPVEIEKIKQKVSVARINTPVSESGMQEPGSQNPDIYYLIFDEAAGFEAIRQYWHYPEVDEFVKNLKSKGFYVVEKSHGHTVFTLYEIATRLNYEELPRVSNLDDNYIMWSQEITRNRVMLFLKNLGYQIIAYDEKHMLWSPLPVDHLIQQGPARFSGIFVDEYQVLALDNSILRYYVRQEGQTTYNREHRDMIFYTVEAVASKRFSSPKFTYVHLLFPHIPFVFSGNGDLKLVGGSANWQNYFENYKFFLLVAQNMIDNILSKSDPENPPVIILSSDHGARNIKKYPYTEYLENYPEEYKTLIVNALYLPGCDDAPLTQDMDPINTFPIVFNCYFDTEIPLH